MTITIPAWFMFVSYVSAVAALTVFVVGIALFALFILFQAIELYHRRLINSLGILDVHKFGKEYHKWKEQQPSPVAQDESK